MTSSLISSNWPSPAKLNLFLYINGRRADGYHELQTLFQFVDYGDRLAFQVLDTPELHLEPEVPGVPQEENLVIRAARMLQAHTGSQKGARIYLDKKLPMGGGLGGGSSNAATTLVALNHLWELNLSQDELAELGLNLGADVPVFIRGQSAIAEGVGELLTPVEVDEPWYLVVRPDVHVATGPIFQHPDLPRDTPKRSHTQLLKDRWYNDFEETVNKTYPEVAIMLARLLEYAPSQLTGSGSCVFARCEGRDQALDIQRKLPGDTDAFVAKGCNRSPLLERLQASTEASAQEPE